MILSKLIVKWLEWIVEIGIWLCLIAAFVTGIKMGNGFFGSILSSVLYVIGAGIFCAVVFGFFILINDIRSMMKKQIEAQSVTPQ